MRHVREMPVLLDQPLMYQSVWKVNETCERDACLVRPTFDVSVSLEGE